MTNDSLYVVVAEQVYQKRARKFFRQHPDLRPVYERLLADLVADPFAPTLRLHPLAGALKGRWAISLTHSYRIILTIRVVEKRILLLDIGSHDDVYR
jgi:addiction module RelE/StbE family toxin